MSCKWYNVCPLRRFEKQGKLSNKWAKEYCKSSDNWQNCKRYQLEERNIYHPDNMLPNGEIDEKLNPHSGWPIK
jgi:hypothetical protein